MQDFFCLFVFTFAWHIKGVCIYELEQFVADPNENPDLADLNVYYLILDYNHIVLKGAFGPWDGGLCSTECYLVFRVHGVMKTHLKEKNTFSDL